MENEQENQEEKKSDFKGRCPHCNSTLGYFRIRDKSWQCRSCGHREKLGEEENEENKDE